MIFFWFIAAFCTIFDFGLSIVLMLTDWILSDYWTIAVIEKFSTFQVENNLNWLNSVKSNCFLSPSLSLSHTFTSSHCEEMSVSSICSFVLFDCEVVNVFSKNVMTLYQLSFDRLCRLSRLQFCVSFQHFKSFQFYQFDRQFALDKILHKWI